MTLVQKLNYTKGNGLLQHSYFKRLALPIIMLLAMFLSGTGKALAADANTSEDNTDSVRIAMEAAVAAVKPALVRIHVVSAQYDRGREIKIESSGSGVIITKEGHIVTNHHVAGDAKRIVCTMADRSEIEADLVGTDPLADLAVIKLHGNKEYPTATFGDSSKLTVGTRVLAMGSPLALSQSVTTGIVSNTEMIMPEFFWPMKLEMSGEDVGSMVRWIGHDAQIFEGNSGGPLVDFKGRIIGINEISFGLAGAIPGNLVKSVADQIIQHGRVIRSWIGVDVQPLMKNMKLDHGALVSSVTPGSPAQKAGIKPGDIITKLGEQTVSVRFPEELPVFNQTIASLPVGQAIDITILRSSQELPLKVTTQERDKAEEKEREFKNLGLCGTNISAPMAREMKRDNMSGVLVTSVRPGGPSEDAKPAIREEDIIAEVGGKPVKNISDLAAVVAEIVKGKTEPTATLVAFDRKTERYITVIDIGEREDEDPGLEVRKAWLPAATQVLTTDIAEALGLKGRTGVRITQVYPGTAADVAGLKVGDIIIKLDGEEISASQPEDTEVLPAMIRQYEIGSTTELTVIRNKIPIKLKVKLASSPKLEREMKKFHEANFDFIVRDIGFMDRVKEDLDKRINGAYVDSVEEGGWAALARLAVGDVILEADGKPVPNMASLEGIMKQVAVTKPDTMVFRVQRGVNELFIEMQPRWNDTQN